MYIKSLKLRNYRKFVKEKFEFDEHITLITGLNAQGKSTILEAICLLTGGIGGLAGSNTSENQDLINYNGKDLVSRIDAEIVNTDGDTDTLSLIIRENRKEFLYNNKRTRNNRNVASTLFSPEQIELLTVSPSKRRDFLNNIISKIDIEYGLQLKRYEKILKHRNSILRKLAKNFYETGVIESPSKDMDFWTEELAKMCSIIMQKRSEIIRLINESRDGFDLIYLPSLTLSQFEDMADIQSLKEIHLKEMHEKYRRDVAIGYTKTGIHRDDWSIVTDKDLKKFGSRGEKRVALGQLYFRVQEILAQKLGFYPVLLLDDISSELDAYNIDKIFSHEVISKQQVISTALNIPPILKKQKSKKIISLS